jgi:hypothetical protein
MISTDEYNSNRIGDQSRDRKEELEALLKELSDRELELATLENELSGFEKRYASSVGVLFAELDLIEKEISAELYRMHPDENYRQGYKYAEQKAQTSSDAINFKRRKTENDTYIPTQAMKELFHKVAKIIHPDLATSSMEREFRTKLMARANAAYKAGDMQALQEILDEWDNRDEASFAEKTDKSEIDQLEQKIAQIKIRLVQIEKRISELKKTELYLLMTRVHQAEQEGRDLIAQMEKNLHEKIRLAKELLNSLKGQERVI